MNAPVITLTLLAFARPDDESFRVVARGPFVIVGGHFSNRPVLVGYCAIEIGAESFTVIDGVTYAFAETVEEIANALDARAVRGPRAE